MLPASLRDAGVCRNKPWRHSRGRRKRLTRATDYAKLTGELTEQRTAFQESQPQAYSAKRQQ